MALMQVPITLDALDDNNAIFKGLEEGEVTVNTFFGQATATAEYPALCISRDMWSDMGCPTVLELTLDRIAVPDAPE